MTQHRIKRVAAGRTGVLHRGSEGAEIFCMVNGCFLEGVDFEGSPRCGQARVRWR